MKKYFSKSYLKAVCLQLFGEIQWRPPKWCKSLRAFCQKHLRAILAIVLSALILVFAAWLGYDWYKNLPKPNLITANIQTPMLSPADEALKPTALNIRFIPVGIPASQSVAPIEKMGKTIDSGIKLKPAIAGSWRWQSDHELSFMPEKPWPVGTKYEIEFDPLLFGRKVSLTNWKDYFTLPPFNIQISDLRFYLDLKDPRIHQVIATLDFNYPVQPESLKKHLQIYRLVAQSKGQKIDKITVPYQIHFSQNHWHAYIKADVDLLPNSPYYVQLKLTPGVLPEAGEASGDDLQQQIMVPDKNSVLTIDQANTTIVRDEKDRPEQILTIETSIGVTTEELMKALSVYLLPKDNKKIENYVWANPGEIAPHLLNEKLDLMPLPTADEYSNLHSFRFKAPPGRYLFLNLENRLTGMGGYSLAKNYQTIVSAPEYPRDIRFLHPGALLALAGEKKLSLAVNGLTAIKLDFARVMPDDLNHFITQTYGNFQNPQFLNYSFNEENISLINSEIRSLDPEALQQTHYVALDFDRYLKKTSQNSGLFLLTAQGYDPPARTITGPKAQRLILLTDLGVIVKANADGSQNVWVESITKGQAVADAEVSIVGKNGRVLMQEKTDGQGLAKFPDLSGFKNERTPTVYVIKKAGDISFIPYDSRDRQLNYSRFDVDGVSNFNNENWHGFLFSDRGLYRPGERMHFGILVKRAYLQSVPANLPLQLVINDPRGSEIFQQKIKTNASGYLNLDWQTPDTALTGTYTLQLYLIQDKASLYIGSTTVRVEEFQPDSLKISSQILPEQKNFKGWLNPKGLRASVQLMNLYGTPASERLIKTRLYLMPKGMGFSDYPDYIFMDPLLDPAKPPKWVSEELPDVKTDLHGKAEIPLDLSRYENASYQLTLDLTGYAADGGRGVSTQDQVLISPLPYLLGYKPDGDLNYIPQNSRRQVHWIVLAPDLKRMSLDNLTLQLIQLKPIHTLVKQKDGSFRYQTVIQQLPIKTEKFSVDANGSDYLLPTNDIGDFKIIVSDKNKTALTQMNFSVIGASQKPLEKNAELNLKLDKTFYQPGDTIQLQIQAPYSGTGLITIERDKVYAFKWFHTKLTSTIENIQIPENFEGSAYVNVSFIRDWNSGEIYTSPLSYAVKPFKVIPDQRKLKIDLNVPQLIHPGENLAIQYQTNRPAKIIVYAVDEGILQVADYVTPDPLAYYFPKEALQVETRQIVDQILPRYVAEREISAIGGDEGRSAISKNLNPFKRKLEKPVVYWSGVIDADQTSRTVNYTVPDYFNGSLRVMAVAAGDADAGSAEKKVLSQDNYILTPNAPTFVTPGDRFELSVTVANQSKEDADIAVQLKTSANLQILDTATQTIEVKDGQEKTLKFSLRAQEPLGNADLNLIASANGKTSKRLISLSVRPATVYRTTVISGVTDQNKTLTIERDLFSEFRTLLITASLNPLILVHGLDQYMQAYPYNCTEQLVSGAFVILAANSQTKFLDVENYQKKLAAIFQMLKQRQMTSGGIAYWPNSRNFGYNPFASIYAMDFLTSAKWQGIPVPEDLWNNGIAYLKKYAESPITNFNDARLHAYAIYLLTKNEIVTTNYIVQLQAYLNPKNQDKILYPDILSAYLAASYKMLKNDKAAEEWIQQYRPGQYAGETLFYNTLAMDAQYIAILAEYFPERLKNQSNLILNLANHLNTSQLNSLSVAYTARALSDYARLMQQTHPDYSFILSEILKNNNKKTLSQMASEKPLTFDATAKAIALELPSRQNVFYQMVQAGFDRTLNDHPIKQGIEIYREYRDLSGKKMTQVKLGEEIQVEILIRSLNDAAIHNVAIVDLLPAGFELENDSLSKNTWLDYYDAREDRVIFYGSITKNVQKITYRLRAINSGEYTIPAAYAAAMYNASLYALAPGGIIQVGQF